MTTYYEEVLAQPFVRLLPAPNLTAIARDNDSLEAVSLAVLVITLAVQCENNQQHIAHIQRLAPEQQHALMLAIEQVMTQLSQAAANADALDATANRPGSSAAVLSDEKALLESENASLLEQLRVLRSKYENSLADKRDLQLRLQAATSAGNDSSSTSSESDSVSAKNLVSVGASTTADFILKSQIDNLKAELERSELRRDDYERLASNQTSTIKDLTKKLEDALRRADEAAELKDQLDEFKHFADKLQKSEAIIEKYKKKMEESSDLRKQMKALENQNTQLQERSQQLEEEYRKVSSYKPLMDTYKEQIAAMESKNSALHIANSKLEFEVNEARSKIDRIESLRRNDLDQIQILEEQNRELESIVGIGVSAETSPETNSLGADLNNNLRARIAQLEQELSAAKSQDTQDRLYVVENLLEDSRRLKEKFEQDFMQAFQKNLALENEMKQLRSVSSADNDEVVQRLRVQIADYQHELETARRRLSEAEIAITQGMGGTIIGGLGSGEGGDGVGSNVVDHETVKRQMDSYEKEQRLQVMQINKLQNEKANLEALVAETRDSLLQAERTNEDLKAAMVSFENKTASDDTAQKVAATTQKIVLLTEQNTKVLKALKEAKKHILTQDKQIKDLKAVAPKDNFMEAIQSYEAQLAEKTAEVERAKKELHDTRRAAKREQALMLSAWYSLGISQQRQSGGQQQQAVNGKSDITPLSWLAQQRKDATIHGRR
ncbi:hypothetical protein HK100_001253 [Physocladia obscura]|uniref:Hook C-terminal domain-containing protein n=1 Tax=Physocladia obscura TaxID=109957 RepID=A0AAD5SY68_9FUNG|nr:hypothetical protein HK100_001253 [Physocladia obscura]